MRAGARFCRELFARRLIPKVASIEVDVYGSLALTGKGHGTDKALILGLSGKRPRNIDPVEGEALFQEVQKNGHLLLHGEKQVALVEGKNFHFHMDKSLPEHPNGVSFLAMGKAGQTLHSQTYFSVGGGAIVTKEEHDIEQTKSHNIMLRYPYTSSAELISMADGAGITIAQLMLANEESWRDLGETMGFLERVRNAMLDCIKCGCENEGVLPGGLGVKRRAPAIYKALLAHPEASLKDPLTVLDWVNLYAIAVNEENADGGRVVTAPTNGAAGILPAVLRYYEKFCPTADDEGSIDFLLTAAAIGTLYKKRASISAAEVGCQGEVGVACSMAAAALAAVLGGTNSQVENAAEIGMEHNLGLTCDPIGGFVQVPCIERNAMGAAKAINAARIALRGDGSHLVSLDNVIETMRQTGMDMRKKYKETALGGLAVNVTEC